MSRTTSNVAHKVRRYIERIVASELVSDVLRFGASRRASLGSICVVLVSLCSVGARLQRFLQERSPLCGGVS